MEAVPQEVMRLHNIGPARLRMGGAFLSRPMKKALSQVGQNPRRAEAKAWPSPSRFSMSPLDTHHDFQRYAASSLTLATDNGRPFKSASSSAMASASSGVQASISTTSPLTYVTSYSFTLLFPAEVDGQVVAYWYWFWNWR
jgi:hypothetical protein